MVVSRQSGLAKVPIFSCIGQAPIINVKHFSVQSAKLNSARSRQPANIFGALAVALSEPGAMRHSGCRGASSDEATIVTEILDVT